jgi:hypothetical protein
VIAFVENLFQLGSCFSDTATRVVLQCFRTKKCEFLLSYMIPDDLELTSERKKDVEFLVCTKSSGSCSFQC